MKNIIFTRSVLLVASVSVVLAGISVLYSRTPQNTNTNKKLHVVTSFYPLSYAVNAVGGNLVNVRNLVPAGVEPHDFDPSSRDIVEIGKADLLVYNGASLESWVKKWEQGSSIRPKHTINMAEALVEQNEKLMWSNGAIDPHFWLDPIIMKKEILLIRDVLSDIDPLHKELFTKNANRYLASLDELDLHFRTGLSSCSLHDIVVLHKAFSYLARQYNFSATSIEGISPDEEPSPKELARITNFVREKEVKYIFAETVASPKFSELIAREVGGVTLVLNPIESLTPNEVQLGSDYVSVMETNLNNLRRAMSCN